ncbi:hypothetical protein [Sphaerisporangium sp. TRM90804]|uniref:hypothetical protein n=1 Tax=Sphaerisporangium sp. TRM90804 TaxID=3031113 RepID=UPI0024489831|nr:hypothetical protein [Sphaerisporangium sp. TRM90804]MDH2428346.1 hypothetical protein [Sphaerisporangium sp. TRM90804]
MTDSITLQALVVAGETPHHERLGELSSRPGGAVAGALLLAFGVALVVVAVGGLLRRHGLLRRRSTVWVAAAALAAAVLVAPVAAAARLPAPPEPGVPLLGTVALAGERVPVLVVPNRPGYNLVRVGAEQASAGPDEGRLVAAGKPAGGVEAWIGVDLPAGESRLRVAAGGATGTLDVDTGRAGGTQPPALRGDDGPECASAALGALVAGAAEPLASCPSDRLSAADAAALRSMVRFLAGRGERTVALAADASPRGRAAADEVRAAAARARISVTEPGTGRHPLVVVSGWARAGELVEAVGSEELVAQGTYLAPWLLSAPLLSPSAGQLIPLRYAPNDPAPMEYLAALAARFPGEPPTSAGYEAWRAARGADARAAARLFASAVFYKPGSGGPQRHHHQPAAWLPNGMVLPVAGPLDDR